MLYQKLTTLAVVLLQTSVVRPATLPSEYLDARDHEGFNISIDARDDTHELNPVERDMLNNQNNAYKGIFWDVAYPGGNAPRGTLRDGGCTVSRHKLILTQAVC
jgi:hypothetical protein